MEILIIEYDKPTEDYEDRGLQRIPDCGGHLHATGSGNDEGHGAGRGGRIQKGEYFGQERPVAEIQEQYHLVTLDWDMRPISRNFGSRFFVCEGL